MPDVDYWKPILEAKGWIKAKGREKHEHNCNPYQWLKEREICANDDNRLCDFKVCILGQDVVKIECFAYTDHYWETCFHGKIHTEKHFNLLFDVFIGYVEYIEDEQAEIDAIDVILDIYQTNRNIENDAYEK